MCRYQVIQTEELNEAQAELLHDLQYANHELDFWREAQPGARARIMAGPQQLDDLKTLLVAADIPHDVMFDDLEE